MKKKKNNNTVRVQLRRITKNQKTMTNKVEDGKGEGEGAGS